jgi:hypothetical protein
LNARLKLVSDWERSSNNDNLIAANVRCQSGANFGFCSFGVRVNCLICNAGDVAEWLKAAVC